MRLRLASTCLALAVASTAAATVGAASSSTAADEFTSYQSLLERLDGWRAAGANVAVAATSGEGRDLVRVSVGSGPLHVVISSRLHANEPSGTEAAVQLVDLLLGDAGAALDPRGAAELSADAPVIAALLDDELRADLLERVTVDVFPMLDPDGVENDNTRDMMANTDHATRVTPQAEALMGTIHEVWPTLLVDLHGGPNEPLNIGIVEPGGIDDVIAAASIDAAATTWRTADALGFPVTFFEEHPFAISGVEGEPFTTVDEGYYAAASRLLPLTWESVQLEGVPAVYTETVGLQSSAPQITIHQGASIQLATVLGLLLDQAGMLDGTIPAVVGVLSAGFPVPALLIGAGELSQAMLGPFPVIEELTVVVSWPWQDPSSPLVDWTLQVSDADGNVLAATEAGTRDPRRRSRALRLEDLPAGGVQILASTTGPGVADATLRFWGYAADPNPRDLSAILGPAEHVALCLDGTSLWRTATGSLGLATPTC